MKKLVLLFFLGVTSAGFCQLKRSTFEEVDRMQSIKNQKTIVFIHTNWCQFCQRMLQTTFKDQEIIEKLNSAFYYIDLNAEDKRDIVFNNQVFKYKPLGINVGVHELALQLGTINNQIVYPVICVLNQKNEIIFQYNNYLGPKEFKVLLKKLEE